MTKTVKIYGKSPDTIVVESNGKSQDITFDMDSYGYGLYAGDFLIGDKIRIHAVYDRNACWSFSAGQPYEDVAIMELVMNVSTHENTFSTMVVIDFPDDMNTDIIRYEDEY